MGLSAVGPLIEALKHRNKDVRERIPSVLAGIGEEAIEPLCAAMQNEAEEIRKGVAEALGKIGDARAVEVLCRALNDGSADVRREAAEALGEIGDVRALEPLCTSLCDPCKKVRLAAAVSLGTIGDARAVEALCELLGHRDSEYFWGVAEALGNIRDLRAFEPLCMALEDADLAVRKGAASALGKLGDPRAFNVLCPKLEAPDRDMRRSVAYALGDLGDVRAVAPLARLLEAEQRADGVVLTEWRPRTIDLGRGSTDAGRFLRDAVTSSLVKLGDPSASEALCRALADPATNVRYQAEKGLTALGPQAAEPLCGALNADEEMVRLAAALFLGKIGDACAVDPLCKVLSGPGQLQLRRAAAAALGKIRDSRAIGTLGAVLKDSNLAGSAASALAEIGGTVAAEFLSDALSHQDKSVRQTARVCLARLGDRRAVEPFCEALRDSDPKVRKEAATALGGLRDVRAVKPLCGVLADSDWQVREEAATALGEIADPYAIDPIYKLLRNGPYHSSVSRAWIKALGSIGGPRVFGILCEALNNPNIDDSSYGAPRKGSMVDQELAWLSFHALCDLPMQQPEGVVRWMVAYVNRRKEPAMLAKLLDQLENRLTNSPSSFSKSALDTILRQEDSLKYQVNGWTSDFEKVTVENEVRRNVKLKELASLELSRRAAGRLQERPRQELSPHSGSQEQILGIPVDAPRFGYVPKTRKWWRFWG